MRGFLALICHAMAVLCAAIAVAMLWIAMRLRHVADALEDDPPVRHPPGDGPTWTVPPSPHAH